MRATVIHPPRSAPCRSIASIEYAEQVGQKRQLEPIHGDSRYR